MKNITILGSTGSIGTNTLKVVENLKTYNVTGLAAHSNTTLLKKQIETFQPKLVSVYCEKAAEKLKKECPNTSIVSGLEGLLELAQMEESDLVVSAISGTMGLRPTFAAIESGKDIALANKESLVSGGKLMIEKALEKGVKLLPVDSEHSAIFQCLQGSKEKEVRRIILTASGGPFHTLSSEALKQVTLEQALRHPNWDMGAKVTIDSSTLMNKGLEVIEAFWLFDVDLSQIEVVIHPQSIVHSMVEFCDGSIIAQLGDPSMLTPIQYALSYPDRKKGLLPPFDFTKQRQLDFSPPDTNKFPCLKLAFDALKKGDSAPCFLNAANDALVNSLLKGKIKWSDIGLTLSSMMANHIPQKIETLATITSIEEQAQKIATDLTQPLSLR